MWRDHNSHEKEDILEHFKSISYHVGMPVTMLEVLQIVKDLPNTKSSGLDGPNGDSLKYACSSLIVSTFKHWFHLYV